MENLYWYIGVCIVFAVGYALGIRSEREFAAEAQEAMDQEIAEHYRDPSARETFHWDYVKDQNRDSEASSKRIKRYGHLRLMK